jgi:hypothetical protein
VSCYQLSRKEAKLEEDWLTLGDDFRTIVVADAASSSAQLLRQGSEAYNPATFFACSGQEFTMKHQVSRRHFTKLAIGAAIVGFNPDERSWVTQSSNTARPFDRVPKLDGALLLDEESRRAIAIDQGNMLHRLPAAVLKPGSVQDIVAMVRYANQ